MTAPTPQAVGAVQWLNYAGQAICIVVVDGDDVGTVTMGVLSSLRYNTTNGNYFIGVGASEQRLVSTDVVTIAKITATSTGTTIGLGVKASST